MMTIFSRGRWVNDYEYSYFDQTPFLKRGWWDFAEYDNISSIDEVIVINDMSEVMDWPLFGAKPFSEAMMILSQFDAKPFSETVMIKFVMSYNITYGTMS